MPSRQPEAGIVSAKVTVARPAELRSGQHAMSEGRFAEAREAFATVLREEDLPEAHEGLGWASVWSDEVGDGIESFENAHRLYLGHEDLRSAGRTALWLAYCHGYVLGEPAVAGGWGQRALRLLDGLPPGPEHVWLAIAAGAGAEDVERERALAAQAAQIARGLGRLDLEGMGLATEGLCLVADGDVAEGLRLLDEGAAAAITSAGEDFAAVAHACCAMLAGCEIVGDIDRASEWCERTTRYARRYGFRPLSATCHTSYAGVLIWCGRWEEAERELLRADGEFAAVRPAARHQAIVRLADLRRRQGRFAEAAELFVRVDGDHRAVLGVALLELDRGDAVAAVDRADRYLRQARSLHRAERAVAYELLVRACVACSRTADAEHALQELRAISDGAPTEQLAALALRAQGTLAVARDAELARRCFEDAVDLFTRCGAPLEAACARLDLARALRDCDRRDSARVEAQAARSAFARLGGAHGLKLAAGFLAGLDEPPRGVATTLTARELEVLALIAAGLTNREVASRLVISEHTVHRHVTNIYRKLAVSSRVGASAHARRLGLV